MGAYTLYFIIYSGRVLFNTDITSGGGAYAIQLMSKLLASQSQPTANSLSSPQGTLPFMHKQTNANMNLISRDGSQTAHGKNRSVVNGGSKQRSPSGPRSIHSQEDRQQLSETSSSFLSKKTDATSHTRAASDLFQPSLHGSFECPSCRVGNSQPCPTCRDSRIFSQDHQLIRFLSYVIDFKFGKRPTYPLPQSLPEEFPEVKDEGKALRATQPARMGHGQSERLSLKERRSECLNIHYGYFCDGCNNEQPIIGPRYHCMVCEDFDLCEQCHRNRGHRHLMLEIPVSSSYKHSMKSWQLLSQGRERGSLRGMKGLSGRIERLEEKVHSSNIR